MAPSPKFTAQVERHFARVITARVVEERERCARIAEEHAGTIERRYPGIRSEGWAIAERIRQE